MNSVIENMFTRRSVRKFTEQKISSEDLDMILKTGIYAPSGMNMQT
ncbi:MAG: nitroreductase family protein, partial [Anaerovoracaceae bacterium]